MRRIILGGLALVLTISAMASSALAQLPTGTILGVVKDSSGGVVPAATVTIRYTETDTTRVATTGDDGAFRVPALPVGHYTVRIEKSGFNTETQTGLTLEIGQDLVVNAALQVGTSTQEVTVTGEAPVVNTTNGSLGSLVNEEKMADLPLNGRNWVDLTLMQPGIEKHANLGGGSAVPTAGLFFSSNGAPIRSNNYMLDGAPMVIFYGGVAGSVSGSTLGVDGIREYKVQTNNFGAEYGLSMGSQVTLVSKNGTNSFHGSVFEFLRNSSMDAANFFDTPASSGGKRLPEFKRNNFGGSIGGPIRKGKTFFFAVFEGVQERKGLTPIGTAIPANCRAATNNPCTSPVGGTVDPLIVPFLGNIPGTSNPYFPLPTGLPSNGFSYAFTRPVSEQYGQLRIDHTFSDKDTAFVRYTFQHANLNQPTTTINPNVFDHVYDSAQFITGSETHIFSPNLLNTVRFSTSRTLPQNENSDPPYPCASGPCSFIPGWPQLGVGTLTPGGGITAIPSAVFVHYDQTINTWSDDMFYTRGRHGLKFGTLITRWYQQQQFANSVRGSITFSSLANMLAANYLNYSATTPGPNSGGVQRNYNSGTLGFYVQDDVRVNSRLTLNLGLRYEILAPNVYEKNGFQSALLNLASDQFTTQGPPLVNSTLRAVSPRFGFAWDVLGNGKTSIRGGTGLLYDIGNLGAALSQSATGMPIGNGGGASVTTVTKSLATTACPAPPLTIPLTFPACWIATTISGVDYHMKQPKLWVYNVTVEQQLPGDIGLSVGYVASRGYNIWTRRETNPCLPEAVVNGLPNWVNTTNTACPLGRVNHFWNSLNMAQTSSQSWYDSLQVALTKRVSHGLQFQGVFTWAKNLDLGNGQQPSDSLTAGSTTATTAPGYPLVDRGPSGFDVSKNLRFNVIYRLPNTHHEGFVGGFANGWWVSSIVSAQSGYPFNPLLGTNRSLSGSLGSGADRPNILANRSVGSVTSGISIANGVNPCPTAGKALGTPTLWFDPCAFAVQDQGFLGTAGRNILRAPGLSEVDLSLAKDTPLRFMGEGGQLEFRIETFNIFNHPNFGMPNSQVYNGNTTTDSPVGNAGVIQTTATTSRQVQLSMRISF